MSVKARFPRPVLLEDMNLSKNLQMNGSDVKQKPALVGFLTSGKEVKKQVVWKTFTGVKV